LGLFFQSFFLQDFGLSSVQFRQISLYFKFCVIISFREFVVFSVISMLLTEMVRHVFTMLLSLKPS